MLSTILRNLLPAPPLQLDVRCPGAALRIDFGPCPRPRHAREACLRDSGPPDRVLAMARFVARANLPLDAWILSGLAHHEAPPHVLAPQIAALHRAAKPVRLILETRDLAPRRRARLLAELRRQGLRICDTSAAHAERETTS